MDGALMGVEWPEGIGLFQSMPPGPWPELKPRMMTEEEQVEAGRRYVQQAYARASATTGETSMYDYEVPTGPISRKHWAAGYQAGLIDIKKALDEGGLEAVEEWLKNNLPADFHTHH
jgi:hypothetical protein